MTLETRIADLREKYGPLMTVRDFAVEAGLSWNTMRHYVKNGYAPGAERKVGAAGVYSPEVAARWSEDRAACRREHPDLYVKRVSP